MNAHEPNGNQRSLLAQLRRLRPERRMHFSEALRLAELQANRLRELSEMTDGAMPTEVVADLPRVKLRFRRLPTSGLTYWDGGSWVLGVNQREPETRQRFTIFHELKHIIDHGRTDQLYPAVDQKVAERQAERAADYFAGCVLMPKRLLKAAWGAGVQRPADLANVFHVSERAVEVRISQLGLTEPVKRCAPRQQRSTKLGPSSAGSTYERALSLTGSSTEATA